MNTEQRVIIAMDDTTKAAVSAFADNLLMLREAVQQQTVMFARLIDQLYGIADHASDGAKHDATH